MLRGGERRSRRSVDGTKASVDGPVAVKGDRCHSGGGAGCPPSAGRSGCVATRHVDAANAEAVISRPCRTDDVDVHMVPDTDAAHRSMSKGPGRRHSPNLARVLGPV